MPPFPTVHPLRYCAYGMKFDSTFPIPELDMPQPLAGEGAADIRVSRSDLTTPYPGPVEWFLTRWTNPNEPWLLCGRCQDGYLLRFPDFAEFSIDRSGCDIIGHPYEETDDDTFRHLLLDHVLPLTMTLHGQHALHATAVLTPAGVCAFIGPSGAGKSTLAASFLFAGVPVVSDDCLVLETTPEGILAHPAYPGLRLCEDTLEALGTVPRTLPVAQYTSKRRPVLINSEVHFPAESRPLIRIYALSCLTHSATNAGQPRIHPLSRHSAFMEALGSMFALETEAPTVLRRQFEWLARVIDQVPIRRLDIPRQFTFLASARNMILADLSRP